MSLGWQRASAMVAPSSGAPRSHEKSILLPTLLPSPWWMDWEQANLLPTSVSVPPISEFLSSWLLILFCGLHHSLNDFFVDFWGKKLYSLENEDSSKQRSASWSDNSLSSFFLFPSTANQSWHWHFLWLTHTWHLLSWVSAGVWVQQGFSHLSTPLNVFAPLTRPPPAPLPLGSHCPMSPPHWPPACSCPSLWLWTCA